jgi:PAS domain S-box-containing protein
VNSSKPTPTGRLIDFGQDEIIVSKTDLRGRITYANSVFMDVSGYREDELFGVPHSIVRHPSMPRCVYKLLWQTIQGGEEFFGYVLNLARNGDGYWVFAHVTPTFDESGTITGYHSNRRLPHRDAVEAATRLYAELLAEEQRSGSREAGLDAGAALLKRKLATAGLDYSQFVFSLSKHTNLEGTRE